MACKQETREIRGKQVYCKQWNASASLEMQSRMLATLGDYCLSFVMGDWDFQGLMFVLEKANTKMFEGFVRQCCIGVRVDNKEITSTNFDVEFSGDIFFIYEVFSFVLQVNFKDFFVEGLTEKEPSQ
jgi:hypothetical protein